VDHLGVISQPPVNGVAAFTLPGGAPGAFWTGAPGSHHVAQMWVGQ